MAVNPRPPAPLKLTYDELALLPNDGKRHELLDGEHLVTPAPSLRHQTISATLLAELRHHVRRRNAGAILSAPVDVVLSDLDVVQPDLVFVSRERAHILAADCVRGAPDLVVEILSPGTRKTDEILKRKVYDAFGVAEYWIVDPELEAVKIYRRAGERFTCAADITAENDDVLTTPLLADFAVPLVAVFAPLL